VLTPSCIQKLAHETDRDAGLGKAYILTMDNRFFERPILNSPYGSPARHWELDAQGQPTGRIIEARRTAQFITPIPKPRKHKRSAGQQRLVFDEGAGVSTAKQEYDPNPVINELRHRVNQWRGVGCFNTGDTTSSPAFVRSSARSRRWRPRSG